MLPSFSTLTHCSDHPDRCSPLTVLHDASRPAQRGRYCTAFFRGFPTVWERISETVNRPHRSMKQIRFVQVSNTKTRRGRVATTAGRLSTHALAGRETKEIGPVFEETEDLSQLERSGQTQPTEAWNTITGTSSTATDTFPKGVHRNQAECLWSLPSRGRRSSAALPSRAWSRPLSGTASSTH